jgi:hypothetical protein
LPEAIIEKDFWASWVLKQLFSIEAFSGRLLFKGGTSLSKIFRAINRFSEDIDLAVDYAALGFTGERDPRHEEISKTRRAAILTDMMAACQQYIGSEFLDALKARCQDVLGPAGAWSLDVSEQDPNVVRFRYPTATSKSLASLFPGFCLNWEHTRNLCRAIASRSAPSRPKSFQNWFQMATSASSRCSLSGLSGRRQPSFTRNTTARRKSRSPTDTRATTMTLPCWRKGRSGPRLLLTCRSSLRL